MAAVALPVRAARRPVVGMFRSASCFWSCTTPARCRERKWKLNLSISWKVLEAKFVSEYADVEFPAETILARFQRTDQAMTGAFSGTGAQPACALPDLWNIFQAGR